MLSDWDRLIAGNMVGLACETIHIYSDHSTDPATSPKFTNNFMNESVSIAERLILDNTGPEIDLLVHLQLVYDWYFRGFKIKIGPSNNIEGSFHACPA